MVEEIQAAVDKIAQAQIAAERLEKANKEMEENIKKLESIATRNILGGQSTASPPVAEKKEESPSDYAKRMLRGGL